MWSTLKAMPIAPKILLAFLLVGGLYAASHSQRSGFVGSSPLAEASYRTGGSGAGDQSAALVQFQSQQAQLLVQVRECQAQMTEATNRMRDAAIQGGFYNARPQCEQNMPQWIAQESYLETEIYRIQTGDHSSSVCQVTGIQGQACNPGTGESSGRGSSDDGTGAVENWDRQAMRGNSLYTDEDGEQHELPTQPYYFRDRSSGQYIGSTSPNPPNDGRDYEVLTGQSDH